MQSRIVKLDKLACSRPHYQKLYEKLTQEEVSKMVTFILENDENPGGLFRQNILAMHTHKPKTTMEDILIAVSWADLADII